MSSILYDTAGLTGILARLTVDRDAVYAASLMKFSLVVLTIYLVQFLYKG